MRTKRRFRFIVLTTAALLGAVLFVRHSVLTSDVPRAAEPPGGDVSASSEADVSGTRPAVPDSRSAGSSGAEAQPAGKPPLEFSFPVISPEHAHVDVDRMDPSLILDRRVTDLDNGDVRRLFLVNGGGTYPYHRIEELLRWDEKQGRYAMVRQSMIVADHIIVKLREGVTQKEMEVLHRRFGTRTLLSLDLANNYIVQLPAPSLDGVSAFSALFAEETGLVERVCADSIDAPSVIPNDSNWSSLWCKQRMDCPEAWDSETGDTNIIVAVIDTGVDLDHPDLAAHLWRNPGEAGVLATNGVDDDANGYVDDWIGWDFGKSDNNPDDNGDVDYDGVFSAGSHGTHCSGIIGAIGNNSTQVVGVCWNVRIMALKPFEYFSSYGDMRVYASKAVLAMKYAADKGAKVTSNSYGGPGNGSSYYDGINYQNSNGVLFVAAAGNDGVNNDVTAYQPSGVDLPNVIAVASSTSSETLSSFSNYGETTVDIVAPGSSILSTVPNGLTGTKSGTSMATPQVAGAAGLLYSSAPALPYLSCKQILMAGVEKFAVYSNKCVADGRMNVNQSLQLVNGYLVNAPAAGDIWLTGTTQTIAWTSGSTNGLTRVDLYRGSSNILTITSSVSKAAGICAWTPPDTLEAGTNYQVRLEDTTNSAMFGLSGIFTISPPPVFQVSPSNLDLFAESGYTDSAALTISNAGSGSLTFSITDSISGTNFTWSDSDDAGGPAYNWIDISGLGSAVSLTDDGASSMLSIGFGFPFYGGVYTQFQIGANGGISFSSGSLDYNNAALPSAAAPSRSLLAFWDDLNPASAGSIRYHSTTGRLVVAWSGVPRYGTSEYETFEIVLYPDGRIVYQYNDVNGTLTGCTVGLQDSSGGPFVQVAYNQSYLKDALAVEFVPPGPSWLTYAVSNGTVAAGASTSVWFTGSASNLDVGVYTALVTVAHNDPARPPAAVPVTLTVSNRPAIITSHAALSVPEGSTAEFAVSLSRDPGQAVTVQVERVSGDSDITVVSGAELIFNSGSWSNVQSITLAAAEDDDWTDGSTVIRCSSAGLLDADVAATEDDHDLDPVRILPFSETFEDDPAMAGQPGPLAGQHGWIVSGSGSALVQSSVSHSGAQALQLQNAQAIHEFDDGATNVQVEFWSMPVSGVSTAVPPAGAAAVFYVATNGHIIAYSNTVPVELETVVSTGVWVKFNVTCDYTAATWSLAVDDQPVLQDFPFYGSRAAFAALKIDEGSVTDFSYVDDITITVPPADNDTDDDGLPDDWEQQYFGHLDANPGDPAANGINTVMEAYVAGFDPTDPAAGFVMSWIDAEGAELENLVLQWTAVTGRVYSIYWTSNLLDGFAPPPLASNLTDGVFTDVTHGVENDGFYRIKVEIAP